MTNVCDLTAATEASIKALKDVLSDDVTCFDIGDVHVRLWRRPSKKSKSGYCYSGEYLVGGYSFPILSISHFLTLIFQFNLEKQNV